MVITDVCQDDCFTMLISKKEKRKVASFALLKPQVKTWIPCSHPFPNVCSSKAYSLIWDTYTNFTQHVWDTVIKPEAAIWTCFIFKQCGNSIKHTMLIPFWRSFVAQPAQDIFLFICTLLPVFILRMEIVKWGFRMEALSQLDFTSGS